MGKGRNYQIDPEAEEGELTPEIAFSLGRFSNGMPRVVEIGDLRDVDGIPHVYYDDAYHPVWSDEHLTVEVRHKSLFHEHMAPESLFDPQSPRKQFSNSSYENTELEAFWLAVSVQEDLMGQGEFVPIGIRW